MANTKYTSIKNDYSLVFDKNTKIELVEDDSGIKNLGFCFSSIDEINEFGQLRTIDAIGMILTIGPVTQVNIKQSGTVKDRRNVTIVDESCLAIQVSLWGQNARQDNYAEDQVLAIRGARVSDYNGKSLNSGDEHS
jgi:replication factor A1